MLRLLEHKADIDAKDVNGKTALHWADTSGVEAVVPLLLEHKADTDAKDNDGWTALHWTAEKTDWTGRDGTRRWWSFEE
jgi:ankyrin repeat protein